MCEKEDEDKGKSVNILESAESKEKSLSVHMVPTIHLRKEVIIHHTESPPPKEKRNL